MDKAEHVIFYTKTPEGPDYLSISLIGPDGLIRRRVFAVTDELDSTPHVEGMETKRIFLEAHPPRINPAARADG